MENGYRPLMERKIFNRCERNLLLLVRGISTLTNKRGEKEYLHHQTEFRMEIESDFIFRRLSLPEFKHVWEIQDSSSKLLSDEDFIMGNELLRWWRVDDDDIVISSSFIFIFLSLLHDVTNFKTTTTVLSVHNLLTVSQFLFYCTIIYV